MEGPLEDMSHWNIPVATLEPATTSVRAVQDLEVWLRKYDSTDFGCACDTNRRCGPCGWRDISGDIQDVINTIKQHRDFTPSTTS
jgi:hypothetical protein